MSQGAPEQVARLLALVPWLLAHPGVRVDETAVLFGVSEQQLVRDLNVLWFSGLPGLAMGDYIEVDMEAVQGEGVIRVDNADYLARPLRLSSEEALALLVALRTLQELPGVTEGDAVARTIAKLEGAAGPQARGTPAVQVALAAGHTAAATATVRQALAGGCRLHLTYWSASRDQTTERDVDPMRLFLEEGRLYLEGWCRLAGDVRIFRLDRVADARVLDVVADVPPQARRRDLSAGLFRASPDDLVVTLDLDRRARWVCEYYPCESIRELAGGALRVTLRTSDTAWVRRLALRLGGSASVVDPPELASEVRDVAAAALLGYECGSARR